MPTGVYVRKPYSQEYRDNMRILALEKGYGKWMKGKTRTQESKNKQSKSLIGTIFSQERLKNMSKSRFDKNLKIGKIAYTTLHIYVRKRKPKDLVCNHCKQDKILDLANTGIYNRDLKNWIWLCRPCHIRYDNERRLQNESEDLKNEWIIR